MRQILSSVKCHYKAVAELRSSLRPSQFAAPLPNPIPTFYTIATKPLSQYGFASSPPRTPLSHNRTPRAKTVSHNCTRQCDPSSSCIIRVGSKSHGEVRDAARPPHRQDD